MNLVPKLYVDMDGVLADFDRHYFDQFGVRADKETDNVDWALVRSRKDFYSNIPPRSDMRLLWSYIERYRPIVLTGIPKKVVEAADNKRGWVIKHLGPRVPVICCLSREKCEHARAGDILIDDWPKYQKLWEDRGGRWITHENAFQTIGHLQQLGL